MFRSAFKAACGVSTLFLALLAGMCVVLRPSDVKQVDALYSTKKVASSQTIKSSDQRRKSVRKDAFFTQADGTRLHYRIDSDSSTLYLHPIDHKFDIVEDLKGIRCTMQEKITVSPLSQQLKFFRAEEGIWSYAKQEFKAKSVNLFMLKLPGAELPVQTDENAAFLKGVASGVSFSFCGRKPNFHAEKFQASMRSGEKR